MGNTLSTAVDASVFIICCKITPTSNMQSFKDLIQAISTVLGPTSGLDCEEVDHNELMGLMDQYTSREEEWAPYALGDLNRKYTRNLVDNTNGKSNILVVVWNPGKGSPVHDHANAHCVMKILKGSLRETVYSYPQTDGESPVPVRTIEYHENQATYISDKIGLHKIENASETEVAVSLHLYTPPHAHNYGFNLFDEKSGKKLHIKNAPLFSEYGKVCESELHPAGNQGRLINKGLFRACARPFEIQSH